MPPHSSYELIDLTDDQGTIGSEDYARHEPFDIRSTTRQPHSQPSASLNPFHKSALVAPLNSCSNEPFLDTLENDCFIVDAVHDSPELKEIVCSRDENDARLRRQLASRGHEIISSVQFYSYRERETWSHGGFVIRPGMTVELPGEVFLQVESIFERGPDQCAMLGGIILYKSGQERTSIAKQLLASKDENVAQLLPRNDNEVIMGFYTFTAIRLREEMQLLRFFPVGAVLRERRLIIGNIPPESTKAWKGQGSNTLICRWKAFISYPEVSKLKGVYRRIKILAVGDEHCDIGYSCSDDERRRMWRGFTRKGGSASTVPLIEIEKRYEELRQAERLGDLDSSPVPAHLRSLTQWSLEQYRDEAVVLLDDDDCEYTTCTAVDLHILRNPQWRATDDKRRTDMRTRKPFYTFGDACAGCGGSGRGAAAAGLRVLWAVDADIEACKTYSKNFPATQVFNTFLNTLAQDQSYGSLICDILHISLPCQTYSPAHTVQGHNDDENKQAMAGLSLILERCKPRIVTFENTFGLAHNRHREYFRWAFMQLTSVGYSVESRIEDMADFGVPQHRQRLIMIASGPGESHPGFPEHTHSCPERAVELGRKPWVTASAALEGKIPPASPHHNPMSVLRPNSIFKAVLSANRPARTLCTSGAPRHYRTVTRRDPRTGRKTEVRRGLTIAELMLLQTFPLYHEFGDGQGKTIMEKQIGNAVPPVAFKIIFDHIREHLEKEDGVYQSSTAAEVAMLD